MSSAAPSPFFCAFCRARCTSAADFEVHCKGRRHQKQLLQKSTSAISDTKGEVSNPYSCSISSIQSNSTAQHQDHQAHLEEQKASPLQHINGARHKANMGRKSKPKRPKKPKPKPRVPDRNSEFEEQQAEAEEIYREWYGYDLGNTSYDRILHTSASLSLGKYTMDCTRWGSSQTGAPISPAIRSITGRSLCGASVEREMEWGGTLGGTEGMCRTDGFIFAARKNLGGRFGAKSVSSSFLLLQQFVAEDPTELFLIDGDSLLFDVLADRMVDWQCTGQFLSAIYQMENILCKLLRGGRRCDVIFFDKMGTRSWYTDHTLHSASRHLFRQIALHHLSHFCASSSALWERQKKEVTESVAITAGRLRIFCFPSWDDLPSASPWIHYLQAESPSFIFVSGVHAIVQEDDKEAATQCLEFQQMIISLLRHLACMSLRHLQFREGGVSTFKIEQILSETVASPNALPPPPPVGVSQPQFTTMTVPFDADLFGVLFQCLPGILSNSSFGDVDTVRLAVSVYSVIQALKAVDCLESHKHAGEIFTSKMLILHSILLNSLPLKVRALFLSEAEVQWYQSPATLNLHHHLSLYFTHATAAIRGIPYHCSAFSDFFDGRLFLKVLLLHLHHQIALFSSSPDQSFVLNRLWQEVTDHVPSLSSFSEVKEYSFFTPLPVQSKGTQLLHLDSQLSLTELNCSLAKRLQLPLGLSNMKPAKNTRDDAKYIEDYHWHSGIPLSKDDVQTIKKDEQQDLVKRRLWEAKNRGRRWFNNSSLCEVRWQAFLQRKTNSLAVFYREMGRSLLSAKIVMREIIVPDQAMASIKSGKKDHHHHPHARGGGKNSKKQLSKKDVILQQLQQKKQLEIAQKVRDWISSAQQMYPKTEPKDLKARIQLVEHKLEQEDVTEPAMCLPALQQQLEWTMEIWESVVTNRRGSPSRARVPVHDLGFIEKDYASAVMAYSYVFDIVRRCRDVIVDSPRVILFLQRILVALGFNDAAAQLVIDLGLDNQSVAKAGNKALGFNDLTTPQQPSLNTQSVPKVAKSSKARNKTGAEEKEEALPPAWHPNVDLKVGLPFALFQLQYGGPSMPRNVKSSKDKRVRFYPDAWQRQLLDAVDNGESAVIVAPTSAGKTFISYYCIEQVLKHNQSTDRYQDKQYIVYVAPTKALVNQMSAEVYARHGDVVGVFTRDNKSRMDDCQVLITVPQCLEILLMSPPREPWRRQLRYAIFDEVHCIGELSGTAYARLLPLVACSFLALSATVANPEELHQWVKELQSLRKSKVHLIAHPHRWADLELSNYVPDPKHSLNLRSKNFDMDKLQEFEASECMVSVHPLNAAVSKVSNGKHNSARIQADSPLSASQALQLWQCMHRVLNEASQSAERKKKEIFDRFQQLAPSRAFGAKHIERLMCQEWSKSLLRELKSWAQDEKSFDLVDRVVASLDLGFRQGLENYPSLPRLIDLLLTMNAQEKLPAVGFCFSRMICEYMTVGLCKLLEKLEEQSTDVQEWQARREQLEKELEKATKQAKRDRDTKVESEAKNESPYDELQDLRGQLDASPFRHRFSFLKAGEEMSKDIRNFWLPRIHKHGWDDRHPLVRALFRGIGVHHASLPKAYRDLVEVLFRARHLKIVFATGTLALGINMPCRSAIFIGDSSHLTPLSFRQMSGRAGRRGYDNVGYVVFIGVPPNKITHLLGASIPRLQGHALMDCSLVLKGMICNSLCDHTEEAQEMFQKVVEIPFAGSIRHTDLIIPGCCSKSGRELHILQTKYYFRYAQELLFRLRLINDDGEPCGLAGMVSHMSYTEPANFVIAEFLQSGLLDRLCSSMVKSKGHDLAALALMELLCHFFNPRPLPGKYKVQIRDSHSSPSLVVLPALSSEAQATVEKYNSMVMQLFSRCVLDYAGNVLTTGLDVLPYSHIPFVEYRHQAEAVHPESKPLCPNRSSTSVCSDSIVCNIQNVLSKARPGSIWQNISSRSPFIAISGHGNLYHSARELVDSVRTGIYLDEDAIPTIGLEDVTKHKMRLNSYALDFCKHGQFQTVEKDNMMRYNLWETLHDWDLLLKALVTSLEQLKEHAQNKALFHRYTTTLTIFQILSERFSNNFKKVGTQY